MLNGVSPDRKHRKPSHRYHYDYFRKRASALLRQAYQFQSAADLAHKVPLIVGAIVVLLIVNTVLQYAAGPALHRALPTQKGRGSSSNMQPGTAAAGLKRHIPKGLVTDVVPGGADAELLCVDKQTACNKDHCSKVSVKYHDCKATCNSCETLRASIQSDTGLQIRVVQELSACQDLHPSCADWSNGGKCSREPKAMLELCQASCGFCQPRAVSPLASLAGSSSSSGGSSDGSSYGSSSSSSQAGMLLDECQDDINVCPFLAATGLCASGSMWVETQCARSCGQCTTAAGSKAAGPKQPGAKPTSSSSHQQPSTGLPVIPAKAQGRASPSNVQLLGRHSAEGPITSQAMQEWHIPGCSDNQDRCGAWAAAGECSKNVDFMLIACKASCNNCKALQAATPFQQVQLSSGWTMPAVGFGTAGLGVGTAAAVEYAAAAGYRMFDSAESKDWYDEEAVGAGLAASKVPRDQLFLTSKIHPRDLGYNQTMEAFQRALQHLRTTYLDLLLLHYPTCFPSANCIPQVYHSWQRSWQALEDLVGQGKVRSIGVSNFGLSELQQLLSIAKIHPSVLESRSDPFAINHHVIQWALQHNITFIGYSSLGTQWVNTPVSINPVFNSTLLQAVAARHPGKNVAQIVLRWALQLGQVIIPRSANLDHIPSNLQLFDFSLSDAEMQAINALDGTWKTGGLPLPVA